jgi:hypothetical protein
MIEVEVLETRVVRVRYVVDADNDVDANDLAKVGNTVLEGDGVLEAVIDRDVVEIIGTVIP